MTGPPTPFNSGEAVAIGAGADVVTLLGGSTFCVAGRDGDITAGGFQGLFFRDTRMLSRWEFRLDGHRAEALAVHPRDVDSARHVLRRPPQAGRADSTLLIVRDRLIAEGLRETITLHNLGAESSVVSLSLHIDADFADLFVVKEGRPAGPSAEHLVSDGDLVLHDPVDPTRSVTVSAGSDAAVLGHTIDWQVVVAGRGSWRAEIAVQPSWAGHDSTTPDFTASPTTMAQWRRTATRVGAENPTVSRILRRATNDLSALLIHDGGSRLSVAAGAPWFMTLFGRDSLLTAWMTLLLDTGLATGTLQQLAALQGRRKAAVTEEEPGRIMHEVRRGPASHAVTGGIYYGSIDATPLFVMLLAETLRWGADPPVVEALLPAADAALGWAARYGDRDGDGFIEYRRATDRGLINQGWKDSFDGINDAGGHPADPPIALCEVQGYHYAALLGRADLAEAFGDPATADRLRVRARELKSLFAQTFWLPECGWYAVALDGRKRPVDALTSNAAHCLWTGIAADEHAAKLIERLADPAMDSGFGLRTLSADMGAYNPMSYHNGSIWPHDTAIAVAGLMRYRHLPGAVDLAHRLAAGLLTAADAFGGRLPELYCGFPATEFAEPIPYPTSCSPQAWASAAPLLVVRSFLNLAPDAARRTLSIAPRLPADWGAVHLDGLRLGSHTLRVHAGGDGVTVDGLPDGWRLIPPTPDGAST